VDLIRDFWPQMMAFVMLVVTITRMQVDIDVLKEKVKVLFDLFNKIKDK